MKYIGFTVVLLVAACSQDLSKLRDKGNLGSDSAAPASSTTVLLNKTSATIAFGRTDQLNATVLPIAQSLSWMSLDTSVATISQTGLVTATGTGTTLVVVQIPGGGAYAVCLITVPLGFHANPVDGSTIESLNSLVITFSEEMNSQALIATNYTISGAGKGTLSTNPLAVIRSSNVYTLYFSGTPGNGSIFVTLANSSIKTLSGLTLPSNVLSYTSVGWYTFLGSAGNEVAQKMKKTADGGCLIAGNAGANIPSMGGQAPLIPYNAGGDLLVVKLTASGTVQWYSFFGGSGSENVDSIEQTSDGGYILAGNANANITSLGAITPINAYTGLQDFLVIKLSAIGAVEWFTFIGGPGSDLAQTAQQTNDGGFIVAGYSFGNIGNPGGQSALIPYGISSDGLVVKLSASGTVQWFTFLGGTGSQEIRSIYQTSDSGYAAAGITGANIASLGGQPPLNAYAGSNDFFMVKLAQSGSVQWYTFLGGSNAESTEMLRQTSDGGYILAGSAAANIPTISGQTPLNAYSSTHDFLIIKLTAVGNLQWYTFFGGSGSDFPRSIQQTSDGGYIAGGATTANIPSVSGKTPRNAYGGGWDYVAVKLDSAGVYEWHTLFGGTGDEIGVGIEQLDDGGYIFGGNTFANIAAIGSQIPLLPYLGSNDFLVIRLKSNGRL